MASDTKFYVIFGNNQDTQGLIDHLREKDDGVITVIDKNLECSMVHRNEITYIPESLLAGIEDLGFNFLFYYYIEPMNRKDERKWRGRKGRIIPTSYH